MLRHQQKHISCPSPHYQAELQPASKDGGPSSLLRYNPALFTSTALTQNHGDPCSTVVLVVQRWERQSHMHTKHKISGVDCNTLMSSVVFVLYSPSRATTGQSCTPHVTCGLQVVDTINQTVPSLDQHKGTAKAPTTRHFNLQQPDCISTRLSYSRS